MVCVEMKFFVECNCLVIGIVGIVVVVVVVLVVL